MLGKHIAVTSFDSGPLSLSEQEKAAGWESRKGIAYSPKLTGVENLPHDLCDEWYAFENPKDLGELADPQTNIFEELLQAARVRAFVNFGRFAFHRPEIEALTSLFWDQLTLLQPQTYIADVDYLSIASANQRLFQTVRDALTKCPV